MHTLKSYLNGAWVSGSGQGAALENPTTEEIVAHASTEGLAFGPAVAFARTRGGPALRRLTFKGRAAILRTLARCLTDGREELISLGVLNAGNTRSDAKFDIDGAAATLNFYADLGESLGDRTALADGEGIPLGRGARLFGQHVFTSKRGVAVHINAFNFPAWGMGEKLAVSLLAGVPTLTKPATSTALLAFRIAELWVATGALEPGTFSFVGGGIGDLLSHTGPQDAVAFTGSSDTALRLRTHAELTRASVQLNVEADSLNAAILGPDATSGGETLNLFINDVVKEVTQKAGQKCTAVRRIYVPHDATADVAERLRERFLAVVVGDPTNDKTTMGPLATRSQLTDVRAGINRLAAASKTLCGGAAEVAGLARGYFVSPTLFLAPDASPRSPVNQHEVFGPVATIVPYKTIDELLEHAEAGGGGLVASVYSDDRPFLTATVLGLAPFHGRVVIGNEKVAGQTIPPGTVMPSLMHGGPGRAGGGTELGGLRGLGLYMQRTALQGPRPLVESLAGVAPAP